MRRFIWAGLLGLAGGCFFEVTVNAQAPGYGGAYAPNFYNRINQPLSPYLNLTRGGNTAANYYYGVRPGSMPGAFSAPPLGMSQGPGRTSFFPQIDTLHELDATAPEAGMRPTGHPYGFSNSMGYFGAGLGAGNASSRGQGQGQGQGQGAPRRGGMMGGR